MPFHAADGILSPEELAVIQNVYDRISAEPWVAKDPQVQSEFAKYVLNIYCRGMCDPEKLFRLCLVAARHKLSTSPSSDSSGRKEPAQ